MTKEKRHLKKSDPILKDIISKVPFSQIVSTKNVFHDLISCILEQQIHYRSTKKVFQKMLDKSNLTMLTPDNFSEFEKKAFKDIKLSTKKFETILNIIQHWEENDVKWVELSDEEVKNELSQIKGVGQWTIDMVLIYTLNRPNVFSYDDFHIKQIITKLYALNPKSKLKAQMKEVSEPWHPFKSTAFQYLIAWKTFNKQKNKK